MTVLKKEVHVLIGDFVLERRLKKGYTSTKFSQEANLARATIFNIEKKVGTCVSVANMNTILKALDTNWKELGEILDQNNEVANDEIKAN
jgi:transcriptional regulator with XRE-family HTH domain